MGFNQFEFESKCLPIELRCLPIEMSDVSKSQSWVPDQGCIRIRGMPCWYQVSIGHTGITRIDLVDPTIDGLPFVTLGISPGKIHQDILVERGFLKKGLVVGMQYSTSIGWVQESMRHTQYHFWSIKMGLMRDHKNILHSVSGEIDVDKVHADFLTDLFQIL